MIVAAVTRLVVQELLEGEQGVSWAAGAAMSGAARARPGHATAMSVGAAHRGVPG